MIVGFILLCSAFLQLGLPIVKEALDMFDSEISLISEEYIGSKFVFDIHFSYIFLEKPKLF